MAGFTDVPASCLSLLMINLSRTKGTSRRYNGNTFKSYNHIKTLYFRRFVSTQDYVYGDGSHKVD